jgi:tetrahydromethanopterin S-methyltransferase subunit G
MKNECGIIRRENVNDIKNTLSAISKRLNKIEEKMNLVSHAASSCAEILD